MLKICESFLQNPAGGTKTCTSHKVLRKAKYDHVSKTPSSQMQNLHWKYW